MNGPAEPAAPVLIRASQAAPLLATAAASGVDVAPLLAALGLAEPLPDDATIPLGDYFRLQADISAALADETMHLSKRQLLPGTTDFVMAQFATVTTLHEAMKVVAQSYNLLHGGEYNAVRRRGDVISFVTDDRRFPFAVEDGSFVQFSIECVQIWLHSLFATVSRTHASAGLRGVAVRRKERDADALHLDFWRAPVRFGAPVYALDYDYETATARLEPPPPESLSAAAVLAEISAAAASPRSGREAADLVRQALSRGVIDQTRIAAFIGVSAATLRRRLVEEGTSFRELRQEVLNRAAKRLLASGHSVTQVAEELGFSDWRAFSRAFRAWNGAPPRSFVRDFSPEAF